MRMKERARDRLTGMTVLTGIRTRGSPEPITADTSYGTKMCSFQGPPPRSLDLRVFHAPIPAKSVRVSLGGFPPRMVTQRSNHLGPHFLEIILYLTGRPPRRDRFGVVSSPLGRQEAPRPGRGDDSTPQPTGGELWRLTTACRQNCSWEGARAARGSSLAIVASPRPRRPSASRSKTFPLSALSAHGCRSETTAPSPLSERRLSPAPARNLKPGAIGFLPLITSWRLSTGAWRLGQSRSRDAHLSASKASLCPELESRLK